MTRQYVTILKMNKVEEIYLRFRLGKIDESRNYL